MNHSVIDKYHDYQGIPAMTSPQVHDYLKQLGEQWTGKGCAMELGCWLGASALALLDGLKKANYDQLFWAFDAWNANKDQLPKAKAQGVNLILGQDLLPLFRKNVVQSYDKLRMVKGKFPGTLEFYDEYPIEICIFDGPKSEPVFTESIKKLIPYWTPGVTVLGLLDYNFYKRHQGPKRKMFRAPVDFMAKYGDNFSVLKSWEDEVVVFFKYEKFFGIK